MISLNPKLSSISGHGLPGAGPPLPHAHAGAHPAAPWMVGLHRVVSPQKKHRQTLSLSFDLVLRSEPGALKTKVEASES